MTLNQVTTNQRVILILCKNVTIYSCNVERFHKCHSSPIPLVKVSQVHVKFLSDDFIYADYAAIFEMKELINI